MPRQITSNILTQGQTILTLSHLRAIPVKKKHGGGEGAVGGGREGGKKAVGSCYFILLVTGHDNFLITWVVDVWQDLIL